MAACTDMKLKLQINLAGIIPQNDSCSDENYICTNSLWPGPGWSGFLYCQKVWKMQTALQVRLTLLLDISRPSGKWNSMLTFELKQTCSEVASACKFFVYRPELVKMPPHALIKWASRAAAPAAAHKHHLNHTWSYSTWKQKRKKTSV